MNINAKLDEAEQGIERIRNGLLTVDKLMATHLLELEGEKASASAIEALAKILGALDTLDTLDATNRAMVLRALNDLQDVRGNLLGIHGENNR